MRPSVALAAMLSMAVVPAQAQDRPPLVPNRDVAITYRLLGDSLPAGAPRSIQVAWNTAQGLMRSEMPGMGWLVADRRNGKAFMVMEGARMVMELPAGQAVPQPGFLPDAAFRREGTDTVAGHRCTLWSYRANTSQGRACISADGVMLRVQGTHEGQSGGMEATQVSFTAQEPSRFQRPTGYQTMRMPEGALPGLLGPPRR